MIGVVSYGVSNVGSMLSMLRKIGTAAEAVNTPDDLLRADRLILPGVGAFDYGMAALRDAGIADVLVRRVREDRIPVLGVCLGMQLLGRGSEEGVSEGLGLLNGHSVRFRRTGSDPVRVPHMGWSQLHPRRESPIFQGLERRARFYFVHSYHLVCAEPGDVLATADYGIEFTAMVQRDNIWGAQFHPEKSHRFGMTLLANFARV